MKYEIYAANQNEYEIYAIKIKWYGIPKILVDELAHTTFFLREESSSRACSRTTKVREEAREEGFAHTLHTEYNNNTHTTTLFFLLPKKSKLPKNKHNKQQLLLLPSFICCEFQNCRQTGVK